MTAVPRWLPNAISGFRVLLVPTWLLVAEHGATAPADDGDRLRLWLTLTLCTLGLSDLVDGWLARRYGLTSHLGSILDAVADKIAQMALVAYLALRVHPYLASISIVLWLTLIARDGLLVAGYAWVRRAGRTVDTQHAIHGKVASILLFLILLSATMNSVSVTAALTWLTLPIVVASTLAYLRSGWRQMAAANVSQVGPAD